MILSIVLLVIKFIAYFLTRSLAVLTDATESIVNVLAGAIGFIALYVAAIPQDRDHPYGHGKAEFVSAGVEGALIFISGIMIIYETAKTFLSKEHTIQDLDRGLILVGLTAVVNYVFGFFCIRIGKQNNSLALQASGRHLQLDTFSTLAIIIGLIVLKITGLLFIDYLLAFLISLVILYNGYRIIKASLDGIMDKTDEKLLQHFVDVINQNRCSNWIDLHQLRVIKYGMMLHIDCHLTIPWYYTIRESQQTTKSLSRIIEKAFGDTIEISVHTDACCSFSCPICSMSACKHRQFPSEGNLIWTLEKMIDKRMYNAPKEVS